MNERLCTENCFNCTKKLSIFDSLDKEELEMINNTKITVRFRAGEIILKQGTVLTHIACLTSGLAKIYIEGENNKNLILRFLRPTQIVGGPGLFTDSKLHFSVQALEDSYTCFIDAELIKKLLSNNHDFTLRLFRHANEQEIKNYNKFISLTQKQMHGRIADALLHLSKNIFPDNDNGITLGRQDLADFTAMAKESAIRILKELSNDNIIEIEGKKIIIKKPDVLESISRKG